MLSAGPDGWRRRPDAEQRGWLVILPMPALSPAPAGLPGSARRKFSRVARRVAAGQCCTSPLGGGCLLADGGLGGRGLFAGVAERGGGLGGGGLGGLLGGAGGLQRLGERVCLGGGLGGLGGGGAVGDLARALVFGMTTGLGLFSAAARPGSW